MKILIVDDEVDILEIIAFFVEDKFTESIKITTARSGDDAINRLSKSHFDICISDHNMPSGKGSDIWNYISKYNLKTKFVLCSSINTAEINRVYGDKALYFLIVKPDIDNGVAELYKKIVSERTTSNNELNTSHPSQYIPITIGLLTMIKNIPCDLYISLTEQKYLKCVNKGEVFTDEDFKKYSDKSILKLYTPRGDGEELLVNLVKSTLVKIINDSKKPLDAKINEVHFQLISLLKSYGLTDELVTIAKSAIDETVNGIIKNEKQYRYWERIDLMGDYPSRLYTLQSIICGALTKKISWCSKDTLQKLVMASFFQDVTLDSIKLMQLIDYSDFLKEMDTFSKSEIDNYLHHPIKSKDIFSKLTDSSPDIDKIILEQHEMPDGSGFPRQLSASQIGRISAMFIISGIMSKFILKYEQSLDSKKLFGYLEEKSYDKGNYKEIYTCLKSFFTIST